MNKCVKSISVFSMLFFVTVFYSQELPPEPVADNDKNWISTISYDLNGQTLSKGVSYFNDLGKSTQGQSWDVLTNKIWANQTLYDYQGRPAFQSLSAPKGTAFGYKSDFIQTFTNTTYTTAHFDSDENTLNAVSNTTENTLGYFYGYDYENTSNPNPYQDITSYPFTRTVYSKLNPGATKKVLGGNRVNGQWKQSYSFTMPAAQELATPKAFGLSGYNNYEITKTVSRDVHGVEVVVFTDSDGNTLAAARSGNEENPTLERYQMVSTIKEQGFVDIHIPVGCYGVSVANTQYFKLKIFNLITETEIPVNELAFSELPPGFYRIAWFNPETFVYNPSNEITLTYDINYYDYSLNTYDKAGRLLSASQPIGTNTKSTFKYNSLGQLIQTMSPDEGEARFIYREDGQIRFSRNSKQKENKEFSYTNYDDLGRPIESGVYYGADFNPDTYTITNNPDYYRWFNDEIFTIVNDEDGLDDDFKKEQHFTLYDVPESQDLEKFIDICGIPKANYKQTFLYGNVSKTSTSVDGRANSTWYSYDVYGRVKWMVQWVSGLCAQTIDYTYDPITGQVLKVDFQKHVPSDRFVHVYEYNIAGQLVEVNTSLDDINFTKNAKYYYTETGQLRRTEIAEDLQGIDYVYNLNGQLKAINSPYTTGFTDPGNDSPSTNGFKTDVFGMVIDYHSDDYKRRGHNLNFGLPINSPNNQFNGNIGSVKWNTNNISAPNTDTYNYGYNKNNWLSQANYGTSAMEETTLIDPDTGLPIGTGIYRPEFTQDANADYQVSNITYDENGNIKTLKRNGVTDANGSNDMDDFVYHYKDNKNQLTAVEDKNDNVDPTRFNDLKNQYEDASTSNYIYNSIGQLEINMQDEIVYDYNTSGLVTKISGFAANNTNTWATIYKNDFVLATDNDASNWSFEIPNGQIEFVQASLNYVNNPFEETDCTVISSMYGTSLSLTMDNALAQGQYKTIANALHSLDMDVIVRHSKAIAGGSLIPAGAIIRIKDANGVVLTSAVYNSPNPSLNPDPDLVCDPNAGPLCVDTDCDTFFEEHSNLQFTPTTDSIIIEVERDCTSRGFIYLDNIDLKAATDTKVAFFYNDRGQRVRKESYTSAELFTTYYVRDASGSVMANYTKTERGDVKQEELPVYGASRLGIVDRRRDYLYQLTDHLGNVRAVVMKQGENALSLLDRTDYYPFGMPMPNKHVEDEYRYGFQGQEKDPETGMEAFELRLWDSRIGRWLTTDPYGQFASPYLGMGNNPISNIDLDGGYVFLYGKRITKTHLRTILATAEGRKLMEYVNSPHKHVHIAVQKGLKKDAFGNTLSTALTSSNNDPILLTSSMVKSQKIREYLSPFLGTAQLEKGANYFVKIDVDLNYKRWEETSVAESVFHEMYAHIYMKENGIGAPSEDDPFSGQHMEFSGQPNGMASPFYDMAPEYYDTLPLYKFLNEIDTEAFLKSYFRNIIKLIPAGVNRRKVEAIIVSPRDFKSSSQN